MELQFLPSATNSSSPESPMFAYDLPQQIRLILSKNDDECALLMPQFQVEQRTNCILRLNGILLESDTSALQVALFLGKVSTARALLPNHQFNVNRLNQSALHFAAAFCPELCSSLQQQLFVIADEFFINQSVSFKNVTALTLACYQQHFSVVHLLQQEFGVLSELQTTQRRFCFANQFVDDSETRNVLIQDQYFMLAYYNDQRLFQLCGDIKIVNCLNQSLLMCACMNDSADIALQLISLVNLSDKMNKNALFYAVKNEAAQCAELLRHFESVENFVSKRELFVPEKLIHVFWAKKWDE
ncbi:Ankyrin_repeat-containing domain superfamily [Hexamita inflata]|uniref:Ankyrin repeat-containing domain superfamily n=1 Tax=Hexamita inflata TaxID=28002 RepID=A0AA86Q420_9EUKA|nr:Ankyrin repeat-containing domain superfamily [Hexamita inflata]